MYDTVVSVESKTNKRSRKQVTVATPFDKSPVKRGRGRSKTTDSNKDVTDDDDKTGNIDDGVNVKTDSTEERVKESDEEIPATQAYSEQPDDQVTIIYLYFHYSV